MGLRFSNTWMCERFPRKRPPKRAYRSGVDQSRGLAGGPAVPIRKPCLSDSGGGPDGTMFASIKHSRASCRYSFALLATTAARFHLREPRPESRRGGVPGDLVAQRGRKRFEGSDWENVSPLYWFLLSPPAFREGSHGRLARRQGAAAAPDNRARILLHSGTPHLCPCCLWMISDPKTRAQSDVPRSSPRTNGCSHGFTTSRARPFAFCTVGEHKDSAAGDVPSSLSVVSNPYRQSQCDPVRPLAE
jgi:hypothetical protein